MTNIRRSKFATFIVLILGVGFILPSVTFATETISVVDLGTLPGGKKSTATDINEAGDIVGNSKSKLGVTHAFFVQ